MDISELNPSILDLIGLVQGLEIYIAHQWLRPWLWYNHLMNILKKIR